MPPGTAFRGGAEGVGRDRVLCYCGEYYDEETGTYYLRARYYAPRLGRFTQEDSARDGLNWYVYCGNDPINFSDPDGQKRTGRNTRGGFTSVQSPEEFFDPNTNIEPIQGNIGSWKISGQAQLGYTEGIKRVEATQSITDPDKAGKLMFGLFPKISELNVNVKAETDIKGGGTIALKGVGDVMTAQGQIGGGISHDRIGFGIGGVASILSGRGTLAITTKTGWEFELGLTGRLGSIGASAIYGYGYDKKKGQYNFQWGGGVNMGAGIETLIRVNVPKSATQQPATRQSITR